MKENKEILNIKNKNNKLSPEAWIYENKYNLALSDLPNFIG